MAFTLTFSRSEVKAWAGRYVAEQKPQEREDEDCILNVIAPRTRQAQYLTQEDFIAICAWKSRRPRKLAARNSAEFIHDVSRIAFTTTNEQLRIEVLTLLRGVEWPTASVLLHFCAAEPYPILDFRALESLSIEKQNYDFSFWWDYTLFCRQLAAECGVTMRVLDRALWQYSRSKGQK